MDSLCHAVCCAPAVRIQLQITQISPLSIQQAVSQADTSTQPVYARPSMSFSVMPGSVLLHASDTWEPAAKHSGQHTYIIAAMRSASPSD